MVNQQTNPTSGVSCCCRTQQKPIDDDDNQANWESSKNTRSATQLYPTVPCNPTYKQTNYILIAISMELFSCTLSISDELNCASVYTHATAVNGRTQWYSLLNAPSTGRLLAFFSIPWKRNILFVYYYSRNWASERMQEYYWRIVFDMDSLFFLLLKSRRWSLENWMLSYLLYARNMNSLCGISFWSIVFFKVFVFLKPYC